MLEKKLNKLLEEAKERMKWQVIIMIHLIV